MQQPPGFPPPPQGPYPQQQWPGAPAPYGYAREQRPGSVTAAGVILIVVGSFAALFGVLFLIAGVALSGRDVGPFRNVGATVAVIGAMVVVYAVFEIISGAKVLALRNGWRVAGIVFASIGVLFSFLSFIGSFSSQNTVDFNSNELVVHHGPNVGGIVTGAALVAVYLFVLVALGRNGEHFHRGPAQQQWQQPVQQQLPPAQQQWLPPAQQQPQPGWPPGQQQWPPQGGGGGYSQ